ncbi:TrmH family RNA methyltransferase [Candidatus Saccharibacteria bacterium]|nr:TrmH family RNA methyltransferase [Candidatus Saccharibacteria bacterium]
MQKQIVLLADNIRSSHNVGSLFRTAECLGVKAFYLCGYTPHPRKKNDDRLPHVALKNHNQIIKTSLGSEKSLKWKYYKNLTDAINKFKSQGYRIVALEQASNSIKLNEYLPRNKTVLIIGNEPKGVSATTLDLCDDIIEIPMHGQKESLNVVQAAAIALYGLQEA